MDQPGKVANPARGQQNRENEHSPVPVRAVLDFKFIPDTGMFFCVLILFSCPYMVINISVQHKWVSPRNYIVDPMC